MITNYVVCDGRSEYELIASMRGRAGQVGAEINATAASVMQEVEKRGFDAVREYSVKFDGAEPYEIPAERLAQAVESCSRELIAALTKCAANVRDYQQKLLTETRQWQSPTPGGTVGQIVRGLTRVGIYVPGGKAAYPSSVIMNAVPAKVAGVEELIMATPPTKYLNDAVLAAAKIAGVDRVIAVGGTQAVAAMTYGAGFIPKVDKLVGPGNAYVAAAKRMAFGKLDIDMVAGPSEVLVIADSSARAELAAADLLSQAEHDPLSSAVLLTDSGTLAENVLSQLESQTARLGRAETIRSSLRDYGAVIVCRSLDECARLANEISPEHLEIMTKSPRELLPLIKNAGAIFLGSSTPEPLGDYMAGPSHVLPTSGTARFFSPLSVESFLKKTSVLEFTDDALRSLKDDIMTLAEAEGLTAHAGSIKIRYPEG